MTIMETLAPVAATGVFTQAWVLIAVPLLVAAILLVAGRRADAWGHWLGVAGPVISLIFAIVLFANLLGLDPSQRAQSVHVYQWLAVGGWTIDVGVLVDPLSILFVLLVTFVGSLIFLYSVGYMAHDPGRRRFFGYLNLFVAAMLLLVLGNNYAMVFVGWEGVGLSSYLLIGFWQQRQSAALAAKKAFVANKIGDLGLLAAIMMLFSQVGSLNFAAVDAAMPQMGHVWAGLIGFGLLLAACGKSAQVPLQSWLLDAMEGPTPVSALIHAATMVTAGVYLVVRSGAIYAVAPAAQIAVAIVGTVTLLVGAWIGCAKQDIKKVLAGSTMSQIGYMMLAAGLGPVGAALAIFHLLTHGAFKANMFLGAGSVMHGMNDSTDIRVFGALRKVMPFTFLTFACGYLAIIGFPFTSGFYSKDHIIAAAFQQNMVYGVLATLGAGVTAFYMTRLVMLTFFGDKRWDDGVAPHESPAVMTAPLVVLGIISLFLGLGINGWIQGFLSPAIGSVVGDHGLLEVTWQSGVALLVVIIGVVAAFLVYRRPVEALAAEPHNALMVVGNNELYANQAVDTVLVRPGELLAQGVAAVDRYVVDGGVRGAAHGLGRGSELVRNLQNGMVRSYALVMAFGVVVALAVLLAGLWM